MVSDTDFGSHHLMISLFYFRVLFYQRNWSFWIWSQQQEFMSKKLFTVRLLCYQG